jgi:undecaprenyl-diphosphatase
VLELWQAVVLGLVEGITEYLPVSSTGHLIIASSLMGLDKPETKAAVDDFLIIVQGGAILAVVGIYWPSIIKMVRGLLMKDPQGLRLFLNLVIAFIPSALLALLVEDWIDSHLFRTGPVLLALAVGAVYMFIIDLYANGRIGRARSGLVQMSIHDVTPRQALFIGLLQCIAIWPGTSRSLMTITGGILIGLRPKAAAEFSFLLGLPTLTAACLYKLAKNLYASHKTGEPNVFDALGWTASGVGIVVAALSAAVAVKFLVGFLNRHGLTPFAIYRLAFCLVLLVLSQAGIVRIGTDPAPAAAAPVITARSVPASDKQLIAASMADFDTEFATGTATGTAIGIRTP